MYLTESGAVIRKVALHPEGVDRNVYSRDHVVSELKSPSTRRAWIEIPAKRQTGPEAEGRPPPGGRG